MSRIIECKYECGTRLGEFDQDAHKYKEIDTGEIHTYERCQAAKAKKTRAGILLEQKDDHGNESFTSPPLSVPPSEEPKDYVDHTLAKPSKVKIFFGEYTDDLEREYEEFQKGKKFAWSRAHSHVTKTDTQNMLFTIFFWYEEKL